jgi:hypothetical protein
MSLPKLNPVEPPWYGPVCPVVGEGWHREVSPYPDHRRNLAIDGGVGEGPLATQSRPLCKYQYFGHGRLLAVGVLMLPFDMVVALCLGRYPAPPSLRPWRALGLYGAQPSKEKIARSLDRSANEGGETGYGVKHTVQMLH